MLYLEESFRIYESLIIIKDSKNNVNGENIVGESNGQHRTHFFYKSGNVNLQICSKQTISGRFLPNLPYKCRRLYNSETNEFEIFCKFWKTDFITSAIVISVYRTGEIFLNCPYIINNLGCTISDDDFFDNACKFVRNELIFAPYAKYPTEIVRPNKGHLSSSFNLRIN